MARRPIPTAQQVRDAALQVTPENAAVEFGWMVEHIQRALRTTSNRAYEWLQDAVLAENTDLLLISTSTHGLVSLHKIEDNKAKAVVLGNDDYHVLINTAGSYSDGTGNTRANYWLIRPAVLEEFTARAREASRARRDAELGRQRITAEYLDHNHGDALALLRGLCARAGVLRNHLDRDEMRHDLTVRATCGSHADGTRYAEAVITLRDEDIDAVAAVLAELGITPAAEPSPTDSDSLTSA